MRQPLRAELWSIATPVHWLLPGALCISMLKTCHISGNASAFSDTKLVCLVLVLFLYLQKLPSYFYISSEKNEFRIGHRRFYPCDAFSECLGKLHIEWKSHLVYPNLPALSQFPHLSVMNTGTGDVWQWQRNFFFPCWTFSVRLVTFSESLAHVDASFLHKPCIKAGCISKGHYGCNIILW